MTTKQYLAALERLGLTPFSKATADALGIKPRMTRYYASGAAAIPAWAEITLRLYLSRKTLFLRPLEELLDK